MSNMCLNDSFSRVSRIMQRGNGRVNRSYCDGEEGNSRIGLDEERYDSKQDEVNIKL